MYHIGPNIVDIKEYKNNCLICLDSYWKAEAFIFDIKTKTKTLIINFDLNIPS
jgi:spore coat polysaccharide biosynthesis predicted glycosyltransferase SpsG